MIRINSAGAFFNSDGTTSEAISTKIPTNTPPTNAPKPDPILLADKIQKKFGGVVAVDVEHIEVQRGSITALIGPNGAGKTTLFNLLTGFDTPDTGEWRFDGRSMEKIVAHKTASMGMIRTFQLTKSLTKMSVIENMKLGATHQVGEKWWNGLLPFRWRKQEQIIEQRADELLKRFKLDHIWIFEQCATCSRVRVATLVEHICPVHNLQTTPRILLNHQNRNAFSVDSLALNKHFVLQYRRQTR